MTSRRTFLARAGAVALASSFPVAKAFPLDLPLGFQSFDLNGPLKEDFQGTLNRVAGLVFVGLAVKLAVTMVELIVVSRDSSPAIER